MKKNTNPQSAFFNPRIFAAFLLCAAGASMALLSFAATPPSGTLTDSSGPITYTAGPFFTPNAFGNSIAGECDPDPAFPLVPCDVYRLTVTLPADYATTHPNQSVFVRVEWPTPAADFDLYVWDAASWPNDSFPTGSPIGQSRQAATNFELVEIPATGGTRQLVVQVSTTLPAGQSFSGKIFLGPASAANTPVVPPGNASGIAPRFREHIPSDPSGAPSASLGLFAGEPTIFGNPKTGSVFYQGLYEVLRLKFDDSTSPAKVLWEPKDTPTNISNKATVDPILLGDPTTGRVWAMQLAGGQSVTDISDNDGDTWTPTLSGGFLSGADHQGMGVGPYPTTGAGSLIPHPLYPNASYYCSQDVAAAFCSRSDDGGRNYGPIVPIYDAALTKCVGLHGHPKVAPDGTVYVPNKGCGLDTPVLGNGYVNVVVSEDAGLTWNIRKVPDSSGSLLSKGDPSVSIDKNGKVYLAYQNLNNNHMYVAVSTDRGLSWAPSVDVGALAGINYAVFPAATAGDAGRAAVAFFGTTYNGSNTDYQSMSFPGVWHLYVATTYDGGGTWFVANTSPDNPIQGAFGGISGGGDGRNHYDFIDAETDAEGRVIVANSIGCAASCPQNGGPNTFAKLGSVVRQSGGRRMFAQFDPVEPTVPAGPLVNGYRTSQFVSLTWPQADGRGAEVTGYNVYRSVDGGPETQIRSATAQRQLVDVTDSAKTYSYRVTALSAQGEGASSNIFAPTVGQNAPRPELSCSVPGQLYSDRTQEGGTFPNNDIATFGIAEPSSMPGKLVFVVNNAQPALVPGGNSEFYVFFDPPRGGKSYKLSLKDMEVTYYQNLQFVSTCGTAMTDDCRDWKPAGPLDAASGVQPDGSVWLVIDKAQFGIQKGDVLLGVAIREDTAGTPSGVITTDYAGGRQDYVVVGNDYCTVTPPAPLRIVSRKTHGTAGSFDVNLPLVGTPGIEPRSGGANRDYQIVFSFPNPLTSVSGASVTSGPGSVSSSNIDGSNSRNYIVNLSGVTSGQTIQVKLTGVNDGTMSGDLTVPMSVLLGDTNEDGSVNAGDAQQTRNRSGQTTNATNFRSDVNTDGAVNSGDALIVRANSGHGL
ncbi:MAG TPA: dockerin type I domain-containing protein [Chthoniobacterales bacterium]